jgi:hypothetical protein
MEPVARGYRLRAPTSFKRTRPPASIPLVHGIVVGAAALLLIGAPFFLNLPHGFVRAPVEALASEVSISLFAAGGLLLRALRRHWWRHRGSIARVDPGPTWHATGVPCATPALAGASSE